MPNKIGGSVFWIEKGKQTEKVVDAERAFSDVEQAKAQVLHFEKKGSAAEKKLARLAFASGKERDFSKTEKILVNMKERRFSLSFFIFRRTRYSSQSQSAKGHFLECLSLSVQYSSGETKRETKASHARSQSGIRESAIPWSKGTCNRCSKAGAVPGSPLLIQR